jgi:hypothetical protein
MAFLAASAHRLTSPSSAAQPQTILAWGGGSSSSFALDILRIGLKEALVSDFVPPPSCVPLTSLDRPHWALASPRSWFACAGGETPIGAASCSGREIIGPDDIAAPIAPAPLHAVPELASRLSSLNHFVKGPEHSTLN